MNFKSLFKILILVCLIFLSVSSVSSEELSDSNLETGLNDGDSIDLGESDNDDLNSDIDNQFLEKSKDLYSSLKDDGSSGAFPDCNLTITKNGDSKVYVGDIVEWKIRIENSLNTAFNIHINEYIPKNFRIVSVNASQGDYNREMNHWEITELKEGQSANLTIMAKALKAGNYTNKVELFTDSNNVNGDDITAEADVEVLSKDSYSPKNNQNIKKFNGILKDNHAKTNDSNETSNTVLDMKKSGNPLFIVFVSILALFGVFIGRRE